LRLLQFEIEALDNLQELANLIWLRVTMHILDIYWHRDFGLLAMRPSRFRRFNFDSYSSAVSLNQQ